MSRTVAWLAPFFISAAANLPAAIQLAPTVETQHVFDGSNCVIEVNWRNVGQEKATVQIDVEIFAASSATAAPISKIRWKQLEILAGQTLIERLEFDLPSIKNPTRFLVQWTDTSNKLLGVTSVLAYPRGQLKELAKFAADSPIAVFDPADELKPELTRMGVAFVDLSDRDLSTFRGKLALIGPFSSTNDTRRPSADALFKAAHRGVCLVYFRASDSGEKLTPDFYAIPVDGTAVIVAQRRMVSNLAANPLSQIRFIRLAETAVRGSAFNCLAKSDFPP
jgi:hypothetical protein